MQAVRDVIVQTTCDTRVSDEVFQAEPPLRECIELGVGLWVEPMDVATVDAIFVACSPEGFNWAPTPVIGHHYCFVRELAGPSSASVQWDDEQRLQDCVALSRLVHPTTVGTHFSARLFYHQGKLSQIVPGPTQGLGSYAWVCRQNWRNWLTKQDAHELARLLSVYDVDKMPIRLRRAMWHFVYACCTHSPDLRLTLIVTGLEALVNTSDRNVKARFGKRLASIAQEFDMVISEDVAREAYTYRSNLVHGQSLKCEDTSFREMSEMLETLPRKAVKKAIEAKSFAARFESEASIDLAYPVARVERSGRS
jgi:hypothetical protein